MLFGIPDIPFHKHLLCVIADIGVSDGFNYGKNDLRACGVEKFLVLCDDQLTGLIGDRFYFVVYVIISRRLGD